MYQKTAQQIPKVRSEESSDTLNDNLINKVPELINDMNNQNLNSYIKKVIDFSFDANKYFNDSQPWEVKKKDIKKMNKIIFSVINQIKNISILLSPIIPVSTNKVLDILNLDKKDRLIDSFLKKYFEP